MKKLISNFLLLCIFNIIAQANAQGLTSPGSHPIYRKITSELTQIGVHGIDFFVGEFERSRRLDSAKVVTDLELIRARLNFDSTTYTQRIINKGNYLIKVFDADMSCGNPYKIIEVVTRVSSDQRHLIIEQTNMVILSTDAPEIIEIQFDMNGINSYSIDNREVICVRESIIWIQEQYDERPFFVIKYMIREFKKFLVKIGTLRMTYRF